MRIVVVVVVIIVVVAHCASLKSIFPVMNGLSVPCRLRVCGWK